MAEQSSRDVVDQTLSGGEPSPSDVPASTNDKPSAGGDVGKTEHIAMNTATSNNSNLNDQHNHETTNKFDSRGEGAGRDKDTGGPMTDDSKQGAGLVATRVLELNGLASASDGGEDTASQGGSESDASRPDSRNHTHSGSVKKPGSFKPVSFAKQKFSVPKVAGAPAPPKAPEKVPSTSTTPLGTPQPSSRPRLVAKTTLGMRDSFSKAGAGGANPGGSGPDPNQVWNKNRPVAPPPPKHLTDEELKQQYGIHMTSRIQEDGAVTSEAKWADIDDDEDDWAPETIEWTDGTKVNLTHTHADPLPGPSQPEPKEFPPSEPTFTKEPPKFAPKPTTSIGPNPTILKLGANAERQARTASASSKGTNDKVPSSSTSPAPPSKSPWATLPPVERVSPVNTSMPPPHQPRMPIMRHPQRDDGYHAPMLIQPKEIAADDFNRTWKESQSGAPRELFNSRSGQYEPVADTRRGSWRHDQHPHPRAPAVLQRSNDHPSGPAEPSPAFQTHRSSHQDGMGWGRRRTSSNVSGGSGGFGRRMSFGRPDAPPRMNDGRRGSQINGMSDPALMGHEQHHGKDEVPPGPNGINGLTRPAVDVGGSPMEARPVVSQAPQVSQEPQEDPVALQERIMKEKRLEARQRRIEQEEKEEAAKQERIKQRLAAMGPAPAKKTPETRNPPAPPSQPQHQPHPPPQTPSQLPHQPPHAISSPPKPPVPEPTGAPKQYGMMKVHHPDSVKKLVGAHDRTSDSKQFTRRVSSPRQEPPREPLAPASNHKTEPQSPVQGNLTTTKPEEQHGQRWQGNLKVSTSPWSHPSITATSPTVKNPWKPLGSDRTPTLGNGIFDQPLGFSSRENSLRQLGFDQSAMPAPPNFTAPQEQAASLPSPEARHTFDSLHPIGRPGPIGPPNSQQSRGVEAWRSFANNAAETERQDQKNFMEHFHKTHQKGEHLTAPASFDQTWKQIKPTEDGRRVVTAVTHKRIGKDESTSEPAVQPLSNPLTSLDAPVDGLPSDLTGRPPGAITVRSSRFFPSATEQPKRQVTEKERSSPSPPPPEEFSSHPVFFGDSSRPHVHLPIPKPVVKLPPKAIGAPAPPPTFASMAAAPPRNAMPPSTAISWQEKINSLFKSTSPEKKNVLAVTPATKEALPVHSAAVSVSIPRAKLGSQKGDGDFAVEQVEKQDEMFEDREPGSLPAVRVPTMAPINSWSQLPPIRQLRKNVKQVQTQSIQPFLVGLSDRDNHGNVRATVFLPGAADSKVLLIQRKAGPPRPRNNNNARSRKGNNKPGEASGGGSKKPASSNTGSRQQSNKTSWSPGHPASH